MSAVAVSTSSLLQASLCLTPKALFHSVCPKVRVLYSPPLLRNISQFLQWTELVSAAEPLTLEAYFFHQDETVQTVQELFRERVLPGLRKGNQELEGNNLKGGGAKILDHLLERVEFSTSPDATSSQRLDSFLSVARLSSLVNAQKFGYYASCLIHLVIANGSLSFLEELLFFAPFHELAHVCVEKAAIPLIERVVKKGELVPFIDLLLRQSLLTNPLIEEIVKWTIEERIAGKLPSQPQLSHLLLDQRLYPPSQSIEAVDHVTTYRDGALLQKLLSSRILEGWEFYDQFQRAATFPYAPAVAFLLQKKLIAWREALDGLDLVRNAVRNRWSASDFCEQERSQFRTVETLILCYLFREISCYLASQQISWAKGKEMMEDAQFAMEGRLLLSDEEVASIEEARSRAARQLLLYAEGEVCSYFSSALK